MKKKLRVMLYSSYSAFFLLNWIVQFKYEWINKRKANINGDCSVWEFIESNATKRRPIPNLHKQTNQQASIHVQSTFIQDAN